MTSDSDSALATLSSIFPDHSTEQLNRVLSASAGNVDRAVGALLKGDIAIIGDGTGQASKRRKVEIGGLAGWLKGPPVSSSEPVPKPKPPRPSSATATATTNAFSLLTAPKPTIQPPPAPSHVNLPPLVLHTAKHIAEASDGLLTLIPSVLPAELAGRLLERMVDESEGRDETGEIIGKGWDRNRWYLFDREVESPHTTSFYVEEGAASSGPDEGATHWYAGRPNSARTFIAEMNEARAIIGVRVRSILSARSRHHLEFLQGEWVPNVCASNCYRGPSESVGWHSDALTYLGPFPTIASLSLGVSRAFRLRPFAPNEKGEMRTLEVRLDHGSLLIMHAGCQERWKHCVPPATKGMDVFRLGEAGRRGVREGSKGRRWRERINITFRHYRPDFAPLPNPPTSSTIPHSTSAPFVAAASPSPSKGRPNSTSTPKRAEGKEQGGTFAGTPICFCGVPAILRPDAKGKGKQVLESQSSKSPASRSSQASASARIIDPITTTSVTSSSSSSSAPSAVPSRSSVSADSALGLGLPADDLLFFWSCSAGMQNEGKSCKFWRRLDMQREGRGQWFVPPTPARPG